MTWLGQNLSDEDLNGLMDGTKGIYDNEQPLTYDTEGGMPSVDGAFLTNNFKADWNSHTKRWDCNVWKILSAWGQNCERRDIKYQDGRDEMTRGIYNMDNRIPADQPYFELEGQLRLVRPWAELK